MTTNVFADPEIFAKHASFFAGVMAGSEQILKQMGEVHPHFLVGSDERVEPVLLPLDSSKMSDESYKDAVCMALRMLAVKFNMQRYAFATEAWMSKENKDNPSGLMPSEHPNRCEVLVVVGGDRDGGHFSSVREMHRDADGKITHLTEMEFKGGEMGGRFHGLFDDLPTTIEVAAP